MLTSKTDKLVLHLRGSSPLGKMVGTLKRVRTDREGGCWPCSNGGGECGRNFHAKFRLRLNKKKKKKSTPKLLVMMMMVFVKSTVRP